MTPKHQTGLLFVLYHKFEFAGIFHALGHVRTISSSRFFTGQTNQRTGNARNAAIGQPRKKFALLYPGKINDDDDDDDELMAGDNAVV